MEKESIKRKSMALKRYFINHGLDATFKLLTEIKEGLSSERNRVAQELAIRVETPERGARVPREVHVVNWILAAYLSLPIEQRNIALRRGIEECERRQREETPIPFGRDGRPLACPSSAGPAAGDIPGGHFEPRPVRGVIHGDAPQRPRREKKSRRNHDVASGGR